MSWFSSALHGAGGLAEKAAPFVGMIPGVGTIAGGALGGLGALAHGDGLSGALRYGAEGALSGYGGGLMRGAMAARGAIGAGGSPIPNPDVSGALGTAGSIADKYGSGSQWGNAIGGALGAGGGLMGMARGAIGGLTGGGQVGSGTPFDWAKLGVQTLGGAAASAASAQQHAADMAQQNAQFGRVQGLNEGNASAGYERSVNSAPLRDQAQYLLQQRMGMVPQAFRPKDMFNLSSQAPQMGGIDPQAMQTAANNYKPGMGGVSSDVEKAMLQRYGFQPNPNGATAGAR